MEYVVAQVNIGRLVAPLDSPRLADFMAQLDPVNAVADGAPGFVWRLQTEDGNATALRAFEEDAEGSDGGILLNMSVWESVEDLAAYVYGAAHLAVLRAALPRMNRRGAYSLVVGESAVSPVPGSGLVSMEQAAVAMMQQVLVAELAGEKRVFALMLGPVHTRLAESPGPDWVTAEQVGAVAVAASASAVDGQQIRLRNQAEANDVLARLQDQPAAGSRRG